MTVAVAVVFLSGMFAGACFASAWWVLKWSRWSDEHDYREVRRWAIDLEAMDTETREWIGDLLDKVADLTRQLQAGPEPAPAAPVPAYGQHREPGQ
jgi:hypothetical protein